MYRSKILIMLLLFTVVCSAMAPMQVSHATSLDSVLGTLAASSVPASEGSPNVLDKLFSLLFDKLLGPILNIFGGGKAANSLPDNPVKVTPLPPQTGDKNITGSSTLRGKVIVVDPGHGGSNPGAVGSGTRETDNNLAVSLKLRDKLVKAGVRVIMTRETDRTVAPAGSSLNQELAARVNIAEANNADMFISVHSNSNPNPAIEGVMTFYPSGKSPKLALAVQDAIIKQSGAADKGTSAATFYVLRNTTMLSVLVEMGFVSNAREARALQDDSYRNKIAQGIFNGVGSFFSE